LSKTSGPPAKQTGASAIAGAADDLVNALQQMTATLQSRRNLPPPMAKRPVAAASRSKSPANLVAQPKAHASSSALSSSSRIPQNNGAVMPSPAHGEMSRIAAQCATLTQDLKSKSKSARSGNSCGDSSTQLLCEVWASAFKTGSLVSSSSSKVSCYPGRIEYKIRDHPEEKEVQMIMEFRHFTGAELDRANKTLNFWLNKRELEYFQRYYHGHQKLMVTFLSASDFKTFEQKVFPCIQSACGR
jgi:hypothetical protein